MATDSTGLKDFDLSEVEHQKGKSISGAECDHKISDLVGRMFILDDFEEIPSKYEGSMKLTVRFSSKGKAETVFSSSTVVADQLSRLKKETSLPVLLRLTRIKNYVSLELVEIA